MIAIQFNQREGWSLSLVPRLLGQAPPKSLGMRLDGVCKICMHPNMITAQALSCLFYSTDAAVDDSWCEVLQTTILGALCCSMP